MYSLGMYGEIDVPLLTQFVQNVVTILASLSTICSLHPKTDVRLLLCVGS